MSFLFDVSPTETDGKRKATKRAQAEPSAVVEKSPTHSPKTHGVGAPQILGTIDHTYDCADTACGTQCHDIIREEKGDWYLVCAFCGTGHWAPALVKKVDNPKKPHDDVFRLQGGRFPGMTLDEVSVLDDGIACIEWWAWGKNVAPAVQSAAQAWLAANQEKHLDKTLRPR